MPRILQSSTAQIGIAFVAIALLSIVVNEIIRYQDTESYLVQDEFHTLQNQATRNGEILDNFFSNAEGSTQLAASLPSIERYLGTDSASKVSNERDMKRAVESFLRRHRPYPTALTILNSRREIAYTTNTKIHATESFAATLAGETQPGKATIRFFSNHHPNYNIHIASPVHQEGRFMGTVVISYSANSLTEMLAVNRFRSLQIQQMLIDENNVNIISTSKSGGATQAPAERCHLMVPFGEVSTADLRCIWPEVTGEPEGTYLVVSARLANQPWMLVLAEPKTAVVKNNALFKMAAVASLVTILAMIASVLAARQILRPIARLTALARRIESGDDTVELKVCNDNREVSMLARSFQRVVDKHKAALLDVREARTRAEEASRIKSQFLATMSHEIRTPMNAILGYTELLLQRDAAADRAIVKRHLEVIRRSGQHLLDLINDVLDFSKIEAGRCAIVPEWHDPRNIIDDVIVLLRLKALQKGLELTVTYAPQLPPRLLIDDLRLRQIVLNLVGNAVKYTEHGQINVTVSDDSETGGCIIVVDDTGPGMAPEQLEMLFEPFATTHRTRRHAGTGLGLAITKKLVDLLDGRIEFTSQLGHGTCVSVTLPLMVRKTPDSGSLSLANIAPTAAPKQHVSVHELGVEALRKTLSGMVVLVAEDNDINRELARFLLEETGARVIEARDGKEAVEIIANLNKKPGASLPDVVLMDLEMPILDGYAATRSLREADFRFPIVALTAHALGESQIRCHAEGFDGYLTKPISLTTLVGTLSRFGIQRTEITNPTYDGQRSIETLS